ncbi:MAG TPA: hypothetical protein VHU89_06365 [Acidobacteriaceae bacterium]|jgi:hypothetical protein|nr:hypothetical protein [Acidobacteriaceae bacterium]
MKVADSNPILDWHQIAVEMLMTDADLALLTVASLFTDDDQEAVARLVHNAREVYEAVRLKRKQVELSEQETARLDDRMDRLRARLRFLGEAF